jgi:glucose-6-phosphate 1-dehydrogenase
MRPNAGDKSVSEYLTEEEAAALSTAEGVLVKPRTLANWRWAGSGPPFVKVMRRVRYRREDVVTWARAQISEPRRSTTDAA